MTLTEVRKRIKLGEKYQHFKGGVYTAFKIATDTETRKLVVVYYDEAGNYFTKPVEAWLETISVPRFKLFDEE